MKLLTVAVPCYNSEAYMEKCINSLLSGGEDVEIIIINDGSTDRTGEIADAYARNYPSIVRAVHQKNGGHGEGVNTGIREATGMFFKVVDSDDWVEEEAYHQVLETLEKLLGGSETLDMLISNFVYDKQGVSRKKVMHYRHCLPVGEMFQWDQAHMHKGTYILMHSVIYRTQMLRDCGLKLPSHTFYVDNLFVFEPLMYVKNMYYLDVNLYRYYIGRADQSVNEDIMVERVDQQIKVNKLMMESFTSHEIRNRPLRKYLLSYLDVVTSISSIMLIRAETDEALAKKDELWNYMRRKDRAVFSKLRHGLLGRVVNLPGRGGRKLTVTGYKVLQKFYGFN